MTNSFLANTARSIVDRLNWEQLSRTTLVLPSHRAGVVLKDELLRLQQEANNKAIWAPTVMTLTQLFDSLGSLYDEDELFTIVRLYKLYKDIVPQEDLMPLDMFYGWGRQMIADFTNIDAAMSDDQVPLFFDNSVAAHELEQWNLDPETELRLRALVSAGQAERRDDSVKALYEQLWSHLYELYNALHAQLRAENKGYAGMRQRQVVNEWNDDSIQAKIKGRTFIFVGFNYLLPVERELMTLLRDKGQALFYWDYVPVFPTNEKAFAFARKNSEILGSANTPSINTKHSTVNIISCPSREAQAQYVHEWLRANYTRKGEKIGVVICDETLLESVIYTLPAITLPGETEPAPINITKGFPLRNTDIYARIMAWLSDTARGKGETIVTTSVIDDLMQLFEEKEDTFHLSPFTSHLSWHELLQLESEYQAHKVLNQIRALIENGIGEPFTLKLLRLLIRRMLEAVTMPFHGEPVTDIQIMGVLETRLLDFDKLLLLNVEEGVIPQKQQDNSFIPYYLRKTYSMQTSDERASIYSYNFFRLISRTDNATILYTSADTAEGGKGQSRFLLQMRYSPLFTINDYELTEPAVLSSQPDMQALPQARSLLSLGKKRLSPSALNTYITCPRSFYYTYIEELRPKQPEDIVYASNTLGSFVHHTIEYIYRTYLHCDNSALTTVTAEDIEAVRTDESKMQAALDAAYVAMQELAKEHGEDTIYDSEMHISENIVILGYVNNILERDREDAKNGLSILLLEQERMFPLDIDGVGQVYLGGTIDRLDIYGPQGAQKLRVVDYKSGSYTDSTHSKKMSASWENIMTDADKSYVRQTLIYSHAVKQHDKTGLPIEPHLFFCRHHLTDIVTTIDVENQTVNDYAGIQAPFIEALTDKVKEVFTTTSFPQCEPDKCPTFCQFFALCGRKNPEF